LINTFSTWSGMTQIGMHEIWWDGSAWWVKEPGVRIRRHGLEHQPLGLWQPSSVNFLEDFSGNGRDLTVEAGTELYGFLHPSLSGFKFDGSTSLIYNVDDTGLRITGDITLEFLFMLQGTANNAVFMSHMALGENEAENHLYCLKFGTLPALVWFTESGAGTDATSNLGSSTVQLYQLMHVAAVRSSGVIYLYLNGELANTPGSALTTPTGGSSGRLRIGADAGGNYITGIGTSFKVIGSALSAAQVAAEYNRTLGPAFGFFDARDAA
jgi:hypothetical protein